MWRHIMYKYSIICDYCNRLFQYLDTDVVHEKHDKPLYYEKKIIKCPFCGKDNYILYKIE